MEGILEAIETIVNYIETFGRFLVQIVSSLTTALLFIAQGQTTIGLILGYMPTIIGGACTAFIAIGLVKFIVGR